MQIREFAQQLLYGESLADKLIVPGEAELEDTRPGPVLQNIPRQPGRPAALRFEHDRNRRHAYNLRDLENENNRGALLHHFANHEVLAIELMALALLRFPDAPSTFRSSIVRSIAEEQRHFKMYRARMQQMGFDFGDVPVNDFFWKHLAYPATMQRPLDFAVRMGMTFEQANLDYMRHYAAVFSRLEDQRTVEILEIVLRDEIGHVKNGVVWFDRFRKAEDGELAELSQWEAYLASLPAGLSPVRARGIGYSVEDRAAAGFDAE